MGPPDDLASITQGLKRVQSGRVVLVFLFGRKQTVVRHFNAGGRHGSSDYLVVSGGLAPRLRGIACVQGSHDPDADG